MFRELIHFARNAPSAARLRRRMGGAAHLDHVENGLDLAGKARWRSALVADLHGKVLEIGAGSGAMFRHYPKSNRPITGALQQAFNPLWRALNGQGCNMNRDPKPILLDLGFEIVSVDSFQVFAPEMPAAFVNEVIRAVRGPASSTMYA